MFIGICTSLHAAFHTCKLLYVGPSGRVIGWAGAMILQIQSGHGRARAKEFSSRVLHGPIETRPGPVNDHV
jgi:hypothetical protein